MYERAGSNLSKLIVSFESFPGIELLSGEEIRPKNQGEHQVVNINPLELLLARLLLALRHNKRAPRTGRVVTQAIW